MRPYDENVSKLDILEIVKSTAAALSISLPLSTQNHLVLKWHTLPLNK